MEVEGARPMLRIAVPLVCWNVRAPRNCLAEFLIDPDSPSSSFSMAKERERERERESAREREVYIGECKKPFKYIRMYMQLREAEWVSYRRYLRLLPQDEEVHQHRTS